MLKHQPPINIIFVQEFRNETRDGAVKRYMKENNKKDFDPAGCFFISIPSYEQIQSRIRRKEL